MNATQKPELRGLPRAAVSRLPVHLPVRVKLPVFAALLPRIAHLTHLTLTWPVSFSTGIGIHIGIGFCRVPVPVAVSRLFFKLSSSALLRGYTGAYGNITTSSAVSWLDVSWVACSLILAIALAVAFTRNASVALRGIVNLQSWRYWCARQHKIDQRCQNTAACLAARVLSLPLYASIVLKAKLHTVTQQHFHLMSKAVAQLLLSAFFFIDTSIYLHAIHSGQSRSGYYLQSTFMPRIASSIVLLLLSSVQLYGTSRVLQNYRRSLSHLSITWQHVLQVMHAARNLTSFSSSDSLYRRDLWSLQDRDNGEPQNSQIKNHTIGGLLDLPLLHKDQADLFVREIARISGFSRSQQVQVQVTSRTGYRSANNTGTGGMSKSGAIPVVGTTAAVVSGHSHLSSLSMLHKYSDRSFDESLAHEELQAVEQDLTRLQVHLLETAQQGQDAKAKATIDRNYARESAKRENQVTVLSLLVAMEVALWLTAAASLLIGTVPLVHHSGIGSAVHNRASLWVFSMISAITALEIIESCVGVAFTV